MQCKGSVTTLGPGRTVRVRRNSPVSGRKRTVCLLLVLALLHGCAAPKIMPAPVLYSHSEQAVFGELAPQFKSTKADVLYVTDRLPEQDDEGRLHYGFKRSSSIAFGSAIVNLGHNLTWEDLVNYSGGSFEGGRPVVSVESILELGRFPPTPYQFKIVDNTSVKLHPEAIAARERSLESAKREITRRLALTPRKEVYVYVHGVGNSFDDAVVDMANGWHFLGREGVPVAYTWPTRAGFLPNYGYDRESGEFTIFHIKQFIRALSSIPEVEKIHLLAHSRGTDVVMTLLRELVLEARGTERTARDRFKFGNVVLIAPDLDFEVAMQRLIAEALGTAVEHITIYTNRDDGAIGAAKALFSSWLRVGQMEAQKLSKEQRQTLDQVANMDIITYHGKIGGRFGHAYFLANPAVSSDIIALLRYRRLPGHENGRPLELVSENFWIIDDDYLR